MRRIENSEKINDLAIVYRFEKENNIMTNEMKLVHAIMTFLEKEDREILELLKNDFFDKTINREWWSEKYSHSTYFRMKNRAVVTFIDLHTKYADKYK